MTVASRLQAALLGAGPALTRDVEVRRNVVVRAPDGTGLVTDVYLAGPGRPLPVVLMRSPYGRGGLGSIARLFAERGYHAVIQSTRGTFGSGGRVDFDAEAADGRAAADWIVRQPWSDGTIGTFGPSYLSFTQLALASTAPPQLKAMAIAVWGANRRTYYEGGTFSLDRVLSWAFILENQERPFALFRTMLRERKALVPAFGHLPLLDADTVALGHPVGFYRDWITHDQPGDPYWAPTDFRPLLKDLGIPVTMTAGWYDTFLPQMLADYQELRDGGQDVRLRVGAWHHTSRGLARQSLADAFDWFGVHLLGRTPPAGQSRLQVEVMGGAGWRDLAEWPPDGAVQRWHLRPGGALGTDAPGESAPDRYTYDPADPTPAVGGTSTMSSGPRDNRALEQRPDVLTYTSEPVTAPLTITGPVTAELFVGSSRPHADFFARLCDVDPGGKSVNITDGILRLAGATEPPQHITIDLWPTAHQFRQGHRIRLQVSSGAHPRYARNPGSGEPLATASTLHTARQAVYHDPAHPSAVLLPVV
jgi:putative CocE/NonD family hydrolase